MGINVVIARGGGAVYAVSGTCAHMGCPSTTRSTPRPADDVEAMTRPGVHHDA